MTAFEHLIHQDLQHVWHPGTPLRDFATFPPLVVHKAEGAYLYTDKGPLIDAISSWWCKPLGHGHPAVLAAIKQQLDCFEHVIAANTTHPTLVALAEKLALISHKQHVSFASDGASAIEIAMKLALYGQKIQGKTIRSDFIALTKAYHGETLATLAVSDIGLYKTPYQGFGPKTHFIAPPLTTGLDDPLSCDARAYWQSLEPTLDALKDSVCAVIVEPLVQGAAGMRCYSADFLFRLAQWAQKNGIYVIADEIMTGLCRSGDWLASHHAAIDPDLICLSKGLTNGSIPLSVVMIDKAINDLFYGAEPPFVHSHTYSGNALAVTAALATLNVMMTDNINQQAQQLGQQMHCALQEIAALTGKLTHVRSLGAIAAADLVPTPKNKDIAQELYQIGVSQGALLRPIGSTLYWLPPITTDAQTISQLTEITLNSIIRLYR